MCMVTNITEASQLIRYFLTKTTEYHPDVKQKCDDVTKITQYHTGAKHECEIVSMLITLRHTFSKLYIGNCL